MFQVPRAGDEYSRPDLKGAGKPASAILTAGITASPVFFSFTLVSIYFDAAPSLLIKTADLYEPACELTVLVCHFTLREGLYHGLAQIFSVCHCFTVSKLAYDL